MNICFNFSVYWRGADIAEDAGSKESVIDIQVKNVLCESATCVFVSVRGKIMQINRVSKKVCWFWWNQVRSQKRWQWHQSYTLWIHGTSILIEITCILSYLYKCLCICTCVLIYTITYFQNKLRTFEISSGYKIQNLGWSLQTSFYLSPNRISWLKQLNKARIFMKKSLKAIKKLTLPFSLITYSAKRKIWI